MAATSKSESIVQDSSSSSDKKMEFGKFILTLSAAIFVSLVVSSAAIAGKSPEGILAASFLLLAFSCTGGGLLLRNTHGRVSSAFLGLGVTLLVVSVLSLACFYFPPVLKWIPPMCLLPVLVAVAPFLYARAHLEKVKIREHDTEKGKVGDVAAASSH